MREEIDLSVPVERLKLSRITEYISSSIHMIGIVYELRITEEESREILNREWSKHDKMEWFEWANLPDPLMPGIHQYIERSLWYEHAYLL